MKNFSPRTRKSTAYLAVLASTLILATHSQASRSIFYPNTSSDFPISFSIQKEIPLKNLQGKAVTLTPAGLLLEAGEEGAKLGAAEAAARRISKLVIDYDTDTQKSFIGIMNLSGDREVKFGLPMKVEIDGMTGKPISLGSFSASPADTGQGIGLANAREVGEVQHVSRDVMVGCSIPVTSVVCAMPKQKPDEHPPVKNDDNKKEDDKKHDDHGEHDPCHTITTYLPGQQNIHSEGDIWTEYFTIKLESAATINFNVNYNTIRDSAGPCI